MTFTKTIFMMRLTILLTSVFCLASCQAATTIVRPTINGDKTVTLDANPQQNTTVSKRPTSQPAAATSTTSTGPTADIDAASHIATPSFTEWRAGFVVKLRQKFFPDTILKIAAELTPVPRVLELSKAQPEVIRPAWSYINKRVSQTRINTGQRKRQELASLFTKLERQYPVPRGIMLAIWGMETNYGGYTGKMDTLNSLATLAHASHRPDFFEAELIAALDLVAKQQVRREQLIGSWAGAVGHPQFMPSNINRYAVDADGDGKKDIWNSLPDVHASIANYLSKKGWRAHLTWGCPITLTPDFDWANWNPKTYRPYQEWLSMGIAKPNPQRCSIATDEQVAMIAPAGSQGSAFLITHNFKMIKRYNNSTKYALAVALLADAVMGKQHIISWPTNEKSIPLETVTQVQQILADQGFEPGPVDGKPGQQTAAAIKRYQQANGLLADGYLSASLLKKLGLPQ